MMLKLINRYYNRVSYQNIQNAWGDKISKDPKSSDFNEMKNHNGQNVIQADLWSS